MQRGLPRAPPARRACASQRLRPRRLLRGRVAALHEPHHMTEAATSSGNIYDDMEDGGQRERRESGAPLVRKESKDDDEQSEAPRVFESSSPAPLLGVSSGSGSGSGRGSGSGGLTEDLSPSSSDFDGPRAGVDTRARPAPAGPSFDWLEVGKVRCTRLAPVPQALSRRCLREDCESERAAEKRHSVQQHLI